MSLAENITNLQSILATVNALPEAGGGSTETCTIRVAMDTAGYSGSLSMSEQELKLAYLNTDGEPCIYDKMVALSSLRMITVNDVQCGTLASIYQNVQENMSCTTDDSLTVVNTLGYQTVIKVPDQAGDYYIMLTIT